MRFLLIISMLLLAAGCQKEIKEVHTQKPLEVAAR